jgi:hypothetical protein
MAPALDELIEKFWYWTGVIVLWLFAIALMAFVGVGVFMLLALCLSICHQKLGAPRQGDQSQGHELDVLPTSNRRISGESHSDNAARPSSSDTLVPSEQ